MKKFTLAQAGAALTKATGGGFTGTVTVVTAADAKALPDDAKVTLRGNIDSHLRGKNCYSRSPAAPCRWKHSECAGTPRASRPKTRCRSMAKWNASVTR